MEKFLSPIKVLNILKAELPRCFKKGNHKFPLMVGIDKDILNHYKGDMRFDKSTLKKAISYYCNGTKYLSNVVKGVPRINLSGQVVSKVTKEEQTHAEKILKKRKVKILR